MIVRAICCSEGVRTGRGREIVRAWVSSRWVNRAKSCSWSVRTTGEVIFRAKSCRCFTFAIVRADCSRVLTEVTVRAICSRCFANPFCGLFGQKIKRTYWIKTLDPLDSFHQIFSPRMDDFAFARSTICVVEGGGIFSITSSSLTAFLLLLCPAYYRCVSRVLFWFEVGKTAGCSRCSAPVWLLLLLLLVH